MSALMIIPPSHLKLRSSHPQEIFSTPATPCCHLHLPGVLWTDSKTTPRHSPASVSVVCLKSCQYYLIRNTLQVFFKKQAFPCKKAGLKQVWLTDITDSSRSSFPQPFAVRSYSAALSNLNFSPSASLRQDWDYKYVPADLPIRVCLGTLGSNNIQFRKEIIDV